MQQFIEHVLCRHRYAVKCLFHRRHLKQLVLQARRILHHFNAVERASDDLFLHHFDVAFQRPASTERTRINLAPFAAFFQQLHFCTCIQSVLDLYFLLHLCYLSRNIVRDLVKQ